MLTVHDILKSVHNKIRSLSHSMKQNVLTHLLVPLYNISYDLQIWNKLEFNVCLAQTCVTVISDGQKGGRGQTFDSVHIAARDTCIFWCEVLHVLFNQTHAISF